MAYTTINKPTDYFKTIIYSGTGSNQTITTGFKPDFVWTKRRNGAYSNELQDAIRGVTKTNYTDNSGAEDTTSTNIQSFNSTGYVQGTGVGVNASGGTYVSWNWSASGTTPVSNTSGTISSTVSANTTSGFSIFTYTGTGASTTTVGHGCSSEPKFVIIKNRSNASGWVTYHYGAGATGLGNPNQASLILNGLNASANPASGGYLSDGYFSNVNSTTITLRDVNNANNVNATGNNYVGYAFADVKGFSKFGSWIGNGSADGTFVYTGFKPAYVLLKNANGTNQWLIFDNTREPANVMGDYLEANSNAAQATFDGFDFVSNGFKMRTSNNAFNASSNNYIYIAFAEQPLVGTNNVPCTAR